MKYHISRNGLPAICRAQDGDCPITKDNEHFSTKEAAWKYYRLKENARSDILPEKIQQKFTKGNNKVNIIDDSRGVKRDRESKDWGSLPKHIKLTGETRRTQDNKILYRIKKTGLNSRTGGWIEKPSNIGANGWIDSEASVMDDSVVRDGAIVTGEASIRGAVTVENEGTIIQDHVSVSGYAVISASSKIGGNVFITGGPVIRNCIIYGFAKIEDEPEITNSTLRGNAKVSGNSKVSSSLIQESSEVKGNAKITSKSTIEGKSIIRDNAIVHSSRVRGASLVSDKAQIINKSKIDNQTVSGETILSSGEIKNT